MIKPLRKCEVCGELVPPEFGWIELHDGSYLPATVYQHGWHDDGRPHWKRMERVRESTPEIVDGA